MPSGWPLGLGNMNMRFQAMETFQPASTDPNYFGVRTTSFSSFTSSELDTEVILFYSFFSSVFIVIIKEHLKVYQVFLGIWQSTRSFFQDHSITLGRLIGIRPGEGDLYLTNSIHHPEEHDRVSMMSARSRSSMQHQTEEPRGICIPLILCVMVKISRSRNKTRNWGLHLSWGRNIPVVFMIWLFGRVQIVRLFPLWMLFGL